jgi:hypothetical protein
MPENGIIACSATKQSDNLAFIIGLALQHDGGPFGLSKKPPACWSKQRTTKTSAFLFVITLSSLD